LPVFWLQKKIRVVNSGGIALVLREVCKGNRILPTGTYVWLCSAEERLLMFLKRDFFIFIF